MCWGLQSFQQNLSYAWLGFSVWVDAEGRLCAMELWDKELTVCNTDGQMLHDSASSYLSKVWSQRDSLICQCYVWCVRQRLSAYSNFSLSCILSKTRISRDPTNLYFWLKQSPYLVLAVNDSIHHDTHFWRDIVVRAPATLPQKGFKGLQSSRKIMNSS